MSATRAAVISACAAVLAAPFAAFAEDEIWCPAEEVRREITTPVPDPWWFTPVVWSLTDTRVQDIGGEPALVCVYGEAGTVQRLPPPGADCEPTDGGFYCDTGYTGPGPGPGGFFDPNACHDAVQDQIAWNYTGSTRWAEANIDRLCAGSESYAEPAQCFHDVMHGGVSWGPSAQWRWENAIDLCEGSQDAAYTIGCFEDELAAGATWQAAIASCGG